MSNLNALVDLLLHPEIPYLDPEHIIVGSATALISAVAFGVLLIYVRHLSKALDTIRQLEDILPICSHCKKIRRVGEDPAKIESWQPMESYISEKTTAQFSHGICPECMSTFYKEH